MFVWKRDHLVVTDDAMPTRKGGTVVGLDVAYLERLIPDIHLVDIIIPVFNEKPKQT